MESTCPRNVQYSEERFFCKTIKNQLRRSSYVSYYITETSIEFYITTELSIKDILSKLDNVTKELITLNFFEKITLD